LELALSHTIYKETENLQGGRELAESLVKIIHLCENTDCGQDDKHIGRRMRELIVAGHCELEGDTKGLDRHDGDGSNDRADRDVDERVLSSIDWGHLVNHHRRKRCNCGAIEQESFD
jgi:hypothetical protein